MKPRDSTHFSGFSKAIIFYCIKNTEHFSFIFKSLILMALRAIIEVVELSFSSLNNFSSI